MWNGDGFGTTSGSSVRVAAHLEDDEEGPASVAIELRTDTDCEIVPFAPSVYELSSESDSDGGGVLIEKWPWMNGQRSTTLRVQPSRCYGSSHAQARYILRLGLGSGLNGSALPRNGASIQYLENAQNIILY